MNFDLGIKMKNFIIDSTTLCFLNPISFIGSSKVIYILSSQDIAFEVDLFARSRYHLTFSKVGIKYTLSLLSRFIQSPIITQLNKHFKNKIFHKYAS
jgi:hypothetical protein